MNVLLNTIQIHDSNTKKCANSVISFEPYSNMVFSEEVKITKFADFLVLELWIFIVYNKTCTSSLLKFFNRLEKFQILIPNKNKVTAIWKLARLKGHPLDKWEVWMYLEPTPGLLEPQEQHEPGCGCERKLPRAVDQPALQPPVSIQDE